MASASTVELPGGLTLSYAHQGAAGGVALVLLPGPTDSWRSYEPVLERLPPSLHAVAVSMRGHGDSDKPRSGYRIEDFAADTVAFLDAVGIERAVLTGHSGSCLVARRVAIDRPDRVAGLILEASPSTLRGDPGLGALLAVISGLDDPISPEFARSFVTDTSSGGLAPDLLELLVDEVQKVPVRVWRQTFGGLADHDDLAEVARIAAPTLLVWGSEDPLVSRDVQDDLVRRLPSATLVVRPGAGHTPRWEDPSRFSAEVSAFVTELLRPPD